MNLLVVDSNEKQRMLLLSAFGSMHRGRVNRNLPTIFETIDIACDPMEASTKVSLKHYDFVLMSTDHPREGWAALASNLSQRKIPCAMCVQDEDFTAEIPDDVPVWQQKLGTLRMDLVTKITDRWAALRKGIAPKKQTLLSRMLQAV